MKSHFDLPELSAILYCCFRSGINFIGFSFQQKIFFSDIFSLCGWKLICCWSQALYVSFKPFMQLCFCLRSQFAAHELKVNTKLKSKTHWILVSGSQEGGRGKPEFLGIFNADLTRFYGKPKKFFLELSRTQNVVCVFQKKCWTFADLTFEKTF